MGLYHIQLYIPVLGILIFVPLCDSNNRVNTLKTIIDQNITLKYAFCHG